MITGFEIEDGYRGMRELWNTFPGLDCVVCATDRIAAGGIRYLKEQGVRIPEDVLVTGHGDSELGAAISPSLTTIHYEFEESGRRAAEMLIRQMNREDTESEFILRYRIIERESTGRNTAEHIQSRRNER